jgi:hypothetical protein
MSERQQILETMSDGRVLRPTDIASAANVSRVSVWRLARDKVLMPFAGGLILPSADRPLPASEVLCEIALRAPAAVLWSDAAAALWGLIDTHQDQPEKLLLHVDQFVPDFGGSDDYPRVTVTRTRDNRLLTLGVVDHRVAPNLSIRVTSPARTVLDLALSGSGEAPAALAVLAQRDPKAIREAASLSMKFGKAAYAKASLALQTANQFLSKGI